jgi:hypothetical protein
MNVMSTPKSTQSVRFLSSAGRWFQYYESQGRGDLVEILMILQCSIRLGRCISGESFTVIIFFRSLPFLVQLVCSFTTLLGVNYPAWHVETMRESYAWLLHGFQTVTMTKYPSPYSYATVPVVVRYIGQQLSKGIVPR